MLAKENTKQRTDLHMSIVFLWTKASLKCAMFTNEFE